MKRFTSFVLVAAAAGVSASVMADINGAMGSGEYGSAIVQQTVRTGFGNNLSELDATFANVHTSGDIQLMLTGNIENFSGNGIIIWLDTRPGGCIASTAGGYGTIGSIGGQRTDDWGSDTDGGAGVTAPPGGPSTLSEAFNPDISMEMNLFDGTLYIDLTDLTQSNDSANVNRGTYLGSYSVSGAGPATNAQYSRDSGGTAAGDVTFAMNNSNTAGVNGFFGSDPLGDPLSATTGFEALLSSRFLDIAPGHAVKAFSFVTNGGGDYLANQFMPGLPQDITNLAGPGGEGGTPLFDTGYFNTASTFYQSYFDIETPTMSLNNGSYSYTNDTLWSTGAHPNGTNAQAIIGATGTPQIDLPESITLGYLRLVSVDVGSATISSTGGQVINFETHNMNNTYGPRFNAVIDVEGTHALNLRAVLLYHTDINLGANTNSGTLHIDNIEGYSQNAGLNVNGRNSKGATANLNVGYFRTAFLNINYANVNIDGSSTVDASRIGQGSGQSIGLTISSGRLDLADRDLILDYDHAGSGGGDAETAVRDLIASGYNGGSWDGSGIISSAALANATGTTALGYAKASDVFGIGASDPAVFDNENVDGSTMLVKYTYYGDSDLSGDVDASADLTNYIIGLNTGGSTWYLGDYNYDGVVDQSADLTLFIIGLNQQGGQLGGGGDANIGSVVPEPTTLGSLAIGAMSLVGRRRRSR